MNHMIHIPAISQIRLDTDGRTYYRRKLASGKTTLEALPQAQNLRRAIPAAGRRCRPSRQHGPGRAPRGVSRIQLGRLAPAHRHFGSATSRTRDTDATTASVHSEDPPTENASNHRLTTKGSRGDACRRRSARRCDAPSGVVPGLRVRVSGSLAAKDRSAHAALPFEVVPTRAPQPSRPPASPSGASC